jgi:hypothetical protein
VHKLLGLLQLGGVSIIGLHMLLGWFQPLTALYAALYFVGKGLLFGFLKNPFSFADAICGFLLVSALFDWFSIGLLTALALLFLLQKGVTYLLR